MQLALQVYTAIVPQSGAAASLASVPSSFNSCGMTCRRNWMFSRMRGFIVHVDRCC